MPADRRASFPLFPTPSCEHQLLPQDLPTQCGDRLFCDLVKVRYLPYTYLGVSTTVQLGTYLPIEPCEALPRNSLLPLRSTLHCELNCANNRRLVELLLGGSYVVRRKPHHKQAFSLFLQRQGHHTSRRIEAVMSVPFYPTLSGNDPVLFPRYSIVFYRCYLHLLHCRSTCPLAALQGKIWQSTCSRPTARSLSSASLVCLPDPRPSIFRPLYVIISASVAHRYFIV